jgi:hypothetical protein
MVQNIKIKTIFTSLFQEKKIINCCFAGLLVFECKNMEIIAAFSRLDFN